MNRERTIQFLEILGISEFTDSGNWINFRCPLASTRHSKGYDNRPSAGISINEEKTSVFKCFSCLGDEAKPIPWLFYAWWLCNGSYPYQAADFYVRGEIPIFETEFIKVPKWEKPRNNPAIPIDPALLEQFPLLISSDDIIGDRCKKFLFSRGISLLAIEQYRVRFSPLHNCLVFEHTSSSGDVMYLSARKWESKAFFGLTKEWLGIDEEHPNYRPSLRLSGAWFGLHLVDWRKPVVLVEGPIDALRLYSLGVSNVIASGGTSVTEKQIANLIGNRYLLGYDSDKAGRHANIKVASNLSGVSWVLDWSVVGCKDGGDLPDFDSYQKVLHEAKNSELI